jgi:hypothetical protein
LPFLDIPYKSVALKRTTGARVGYGFDVPELPSWEEGKKGRRIKV